MALSPVSLRGWLGQRELNMKNCASGSRELKGPKARVSITEAVTRGSAHPRAVGKQDKLRGEPRRATAEACEEGRTMGVHCRETRGKGCCPRELGGLCRAGIKTSEGSCGWPVLASSRESHEARKNSSVEPTADGITPLLLG